MDRKAITKGLITATFSYLLKRGFSCHQELGLNSRGKLRGDVVAVNLKGYVTIVEIKSCKLDYMTDNKLHSYLDYCHKFYLCMTCKTYESIQIPTDKKIGVLILDKKTGYLKVKKKATPIQPKQDLIDKLILRMAWRGGTSKRTTRRRRVYLEE